MSKDFRGLDFLNYVMFKLFSGKKKENKLKDIEGLSIDDLLRVSMTELFRVMKGKEYLWLPGKPGNGRNSWVTKVFRDTPKSRKLYLEVYHQMDHTDTDYIIPLTEFLKSGDWTGQSKEMDIHERIHLRYCTYTEKDKAEVIREILKTFVESI